MSTTPSPPPQQPPYDSSYDAPYPPPADQAPGTGPRVTGEEVRDLGRLRRSATDRKIAGVAGGLARHLDIDPLVLRVTFVVLVFFGGAGLLLYGACWLLVPEEGSEKAPFGLDERNRSVALIIAGVLAALALVGDSWGAFWFPWPIALVALVVVLVLSRRERREHGGVAPAAMPTAPAGPDAPLGYAAAPVQPYGPYPPYNPAPPPYNPAPRPAIRKGPALFGFTLALVTLGIGVLSIFDLAGAPVIASAYPALVVAIVGVMLLVASGFGRGGGLIVLGLVATLVLAATTVADEWEGTVLAKTPTSASSVLDRYEIGAGELVLDLTDVSDLDALDGRTIVVRGQFGHLEVIVPTELDVTVRAVVNGPGSIVLFGHKSEGIDVSDTRSMGDRLDAPDLTIVSELNFGEIEVHQ